MNIENDYIGFLTTIVSTANGALPIRNASVTIYERGEGEEKSPSDVIYQLTTDISGRTEKVVLNTKSKDLSTSPDNNLPFLSYDIYVNADGYYDASFFNVPIFQGISSLQNVPNFQALMILCLTRADFILKRQANMQNKGEIYA